MTRGLLFWCSLLSACRGSASAPSAETCRAILDDSSTPETVEEAQTALAAGQSWTEAQIRETYLCRLQQIGAENAGWVKAGADASTRARRAWQMGHDALLTARAMTADAELAARQARDQERYGSPDGPTFEWLVQRETDEGLSGDARYEAVVHDVVGAGLDPSAGP